MIKFLSSYTLIDICFFFTFGIQLSRVTASLRWENFPIEIKNLLPHEIDREKTKDAAEAAIQKVMEVQKQKRDSLKDAEDEEEDEEDVNMDDDDGGDGFDDDDSIYGKMFSKKFKKDPGYDFSEEEISTFFLNLRKNLVFDMGFRVKGLKETDVENCWCPW